jgi:hypothetical protein
MIRELLRLSSVDHRRRTASFSTDAAGFACRSMSALPRKRPTLRGNEMTRMGWTGRARAPQRLSECVGGFQSFAVERLL